MGIRSRFHGIVYQRHMLYWYDTYNTVQRVTNRFRSGMNRRGSKHSDQGTGTGSTGIPFNYRMTSEQAFKNPFFKKGCTVLYCTVSVVPGVCRCGFRSRYVVPENSGFHDIIDACKRTRFDRHYNLCRTVRYIFCRLRKRRTTHCSHFQCTGNVFVAGMAEKGS